jgi:chromosome segregation ATPase
MVRGDGSGWIQLRYVALVYLLTAVLLWTGMPASTRIEYYLITEVGLPFYVLGPVMGFGAGVGFELLVWEPESDVETSREQQRETEGERAGAAGDTAADADATDQGDARATEVFEEAEDAAESFETALADGRQKEALDQLRRAIEGFERYQELDGPTDVGDRLDALRGRLRSLEDEVSSLREVQEMLETAEDHLGTADEAYEDDDSVVARLRYRQARDIYGDVVDTLEREGLEDVTVTAGGHRFDGVEAVRDRRRTAADGHELTGGQ